MKVEFLDLKEIFNGKVIKIIITILIFLGILSLFNIVFEKDTSEKLGLLVKNHDFIQEENSYVYAKHISNITLDEYFERSEQGLDSEFEATYVNTKSFNIIKNKYVTDDNIKTTFIPTYNLKTDKLTYTYRIVVNASNVIFEGSYNIDKDKFTCENSYVNNFDIDKTQDIICEKIKYDVDDFYIELLELLDDPILLKEIKK